MLKSFFLDTIRIILFSLTINVSYGASDLETINILTWWGYLNYSKLITTAENTCHVKISYDEYFSNDEFLRRWEGEKDNYDIIIFSDTIYNAIKNKIPPVKSSTLWKQSLLYNPVIKSRYKKRKYPNNMVYFIHAMTGFLWNPKNISLSSSDSLISIFNKATNNHVVIIDDSVEAKKLIESSLLEQSKDKDILNVTNFKRLIQNADVYITNNYSQIYKKPKFAFSFTWSGEAVVDIMESNKKYEFLIHPKLSYISSDLLAQTSNKQSALCVAKVLTTKKAMSIIQNNDFYFSPYTDYTDVINPIFKDIYTRFILALPVLPWLDSTDGASFERLNMSWQLIKLELNNRVRRK